MSDPTSTTPMDALPTPSEVAAAHAEIAEVRQLQRDNRYGQGHDYTNALIERVVKATGVVERAKARPTGPTSAEIRAQLEAELARKAVLKDNFRAMANGVEGSAENTLRRDYAIAVAREAQEAETGPAPGEFTEANADQVTAEVIPTEAGRQQFKAAAARLGATPLVRSQLLFAIRSAKDDGRVDPNLDPLALDPLWDAWGLTDAETKAFARTWHRLAPIEREAFRPYLGDKGVTMRLIAFDKGRS